MTYLHISKIDRCHMSYIIQQAYQSTCDMCEDRNGNETQNYSTTDNRQD